MLYEQRRQKTNTITTAVEMVMSKSMPSEEEKPLKFNDFQYQFKISFMLYTDIESISNAVDGKYREPVN